MPTCPDDKLLADIDGAHCREFWYGSPLLARCRESRDVRVVRALVLRHHCLANKSAGSCHVLRQTIKHLEGPDFPTLWRMFDNDPESATAGIDNPYSERWGAGFILGEIGGGEALLEFSRRLSPGFTPLHYAVVRCLSHVVIRYLDISDEAEPTVQSMDLETKLARTLPQRQVDPALHDRTMKDRMLANEYFVPVADEALRTVKERLGAIDERLSKVPREKLLGLIDLLPRM